MTGTFFFLTFRTFKNRFLYRLRRMKEIRYLLGAIFGAAYFYFALLRPGGVVRGGPKSIGRLPHDIISLFVLAFLILMWILPNLAQIAFSEAELHYVIGGPVSRRRVMVYKLISAQIPVLIATFFASLVRFPTGHVVGFWVVYSAIACYSMFVAIVKKKLNELGLPSWWITTAGFAALIGCAWMLMTFHRSGRNAFDTPILAPLLFVPRQIARPLFAKAFSELAISSLIVAAAAALMFFLAASIRVQFDELVQTASERVTRFRSRAQRQPGASVSFKSLRAPFRLPANPKPEVAILWKNSIAVMRMTLSSIVLVLIFAAAFLAGATLAPDPGLKQTCAGFALAAAAIFPIFGSMMFKQDYRLDVTRIDVVKTWPIAGERLVAAEIAAPVIATSLLELILLINAAITTSVVSGKVTQFASPQILVIAFLFAVPICAVQILLRNAVAIVFPGWGFRTREEQRGFIALGQRILGMVVNLIALNLFLLPAAIVCALSFWITMQFTSGSAAVLAALTMPAVFVLVLELWLFVKLLGAQYEKMDLGKDLEPVAL